MKEKRGERKRREERKRTRGRGGRRGRGREEEEEEVGRRGKAGRRVVVIVSTEGQPKEGHACILLNCDELQCVQNP